MRLFVAYLFAIAGAFVLQNGPGLTPFIGGLLVAIAVDVAYGGRE